MGSLHYDYIFADDFVVPPGAEADFSEKILRLPGGMHIMDDTRTVTGLTQTRAANGLPAEGVVFGCFCQSFKIQPDIFGRWMHILREVPGSVLWLASGPAGMEQNLREEAVRHGVAAERLVVAPRCGMDEYLGRFALMDLYLDTFPYTSGTVASDALFFGCPLLTLTGRTMVSRMAGSILNHADMPDLVCDSPQGYVDLAIRLGKDAGALAGLRQRVVQARTSAKLFNTPEAVRGLEQAVVTVVQLSTSK
jgi:predicted O-linked N-acetylglucosamine transferase (SPINDLY family)